MTKTSTHNALQLLTSNFVSDLTAIIERSVLSAVEESLGITGTVRPKRKRPARKSRRPDPTSQEAAVADPKDTTLFVRWDAEAPKKPSKAQAVKRTEEVRPLSKRNQVLQCLAANKGNVSQVAREMGMSRSTVARYRDGKNKS